MKTLEIRRLIPQTPAERRFQPFGFPISEAKLILQLVNVYCSAKGKRILSE